MTLKTNDFGKSHFYLRNPRFDKVKYQSVWKDATRYSARQYCFTAMLNGVKYLVEPRRPYFEKLTWFFILGCFIIVCTYLLSITLMSDMSMPVIINFESSNEPIQGFTFPAVTICPNGKLNKSKAEQWANTINLPEGMTQSELVEILPNILHMMDFADTPEVHILDSLLKKNFIRAHDLYLDLSIQCKDYLITCSLLGRVHPCSELFKTIRTTEGYCCSFNYFGTLNQLSVNGYHKPSNVTPKAPLRVSSSGKASGLKVLLRSNGDGYGTMMASKGVKVLLHVATNFPDHLSMGRLVQPDNAEHFAMLPVKISAGDEIRPVKIKARNCIFFNEKKLEGFQQYSYKSCIFNCRIRFFYDLCNCVPFYYPAPGGTYRICDLSDVPCLAKYKYEIQTLRMNISIEMSNSDSERAPCGCLPQCNEIYYEVATSSYSLEDDFTNFNQFHNVTTFENFSEVNVYFKALFGVKYQRVARSTTYQTLANFGGLLGLFMGFSFISAFEVIYSFSFRILFRVYVIKKSDKKG